MTSPASSPASPRSPVIPGCFLLALLALLPASGGPALAQQASEAPSPIKIAILQFDSLSTGPKEESKGRMISEFMTTSAVNIGAYDVVEREAVRKILDEMEFGEQGKSVTSVAQKIGQLSGAQYVLSGSITGHHDAVRIDARLIRVADGRIEFAQGAFAKNDLESMFNTARQIIEKLTESCIPTTGRMVQGQTAWTSPEAMLVDGGGKLWMRPDYGVRLEKTDRNCMTAKRLGAGFEVNVTNCSMKWKKTDNVPGASIPVNTIIY